jgi:hypothetical protein
VQRAARVLAFAIVTIAPGATSSASAQDRPVSITGRYSPYELESIHAVGDALGSEVDPAPEGKIVERVDTVRLDPVERRDPAPVALDVLHTTTKEDVVLHEVVVRPGDRYHKELVDESARNVRLLPQLSMVLCVAFRGSAPDRVRLVVITKDVWSLYPDFGLSETSGGLENLDLEPKETNLGGRQQLLLARFTLQPLSYSVGAETIAPRLAGRWLTLTADANVILNRASGSPEGSFGTASIERPLHSTLTEWSWFAGVTWDDRVYRRYVNAVLSDFVSPTGRVPWSYRARTIDEQARVTRSFGWAKKNDVTLGVDASPQDYRLPDLSGYDGATVSAFRTSALPVSDTRVGPFAQWRAYTTDFLRILDFETLGLQEDYRLGYDVVVRAYPAAKVIGSTRDFAGVRAAALYTVRLGDGFARAWIDTTTEADAIRVYDASISGDVTLVSPRTPIGRVVFDATALDRWKNYLNRLSTLGGESRIRGYPTNYFVGQDVLAMNLELRSRPVEVVSLQVGGSLFYDVAEAFNSFVDVRPAHSVGFGLRMVFPQVERDVFASTSGSPSPRAGCPQASPRRPSS